MFIKSLVFFLSLKYYVYFMSNRYNNFFLFLCKEIYFKIVLFQLNSKICNCTTQNKSKLLNIFCLKSFIKLFFYNIKILKTIFIIITQFFYIEIKKSKFETFISVLCILNYIHFYELDDVTGNKYRTNYL